MGTRAIAFAIFAVLGLALLLGLGTWQVQRMTWKAGLLAQMEARIHADPAPLPDAIEPTRDQWLAVRATGRFTGEDRLVMASRKGVGPGWLVVAVFEVDGRRLLVDRGFLADTARGTPRPATPAAITGNLHWPDEVDLFTPPPEPARGLWYARDVPALAAEMGTEPALIVLRTTSETAPAAEPTPLDTAQVPDNHLNYAITWFSLALIWVVMTMVLLWRMRQPKSGTAGGHRGP
ncbi:SURF1 family protein [Rhodobaculum claviforme]|uniref:SURF1-like protein n=1 Tax=Rhodobaculum claviforme TaxID=1549854 RepID=A0A934TJU9_9RHOB|nr:SURF1 family protein [Rhodobaculum claviforme]MBK5927485.1 cytochrome oxidase biogenesis protein Surf1, facilitates heme A insertion [Rhodobaculum claviforme]